MAGYQKVIIVGNLGGDPELRYTPSGNPVTGFNVAVNSVYNRADGEKVEETTWFKVTAWNRLAENANQFLQKGSSVLVEGRIKIEQYTAQDGTPRANMNLTASNMQFLGGTRPKDEDGGYAPAAAGDDVKGDAEDLPW